MTIRSFLAILVLALFCALVPRFVSSHDVESSTTTVFNREIVRILDAHCVSCHAENNLSFPLTTYEETYHRARAIREQVLRRQMPPWSAVRGYGRFANDNGLSSREIDFLVSWTDGGRPRDAGTVFLNVSGSSSGAASVVRATEETGWVLGTPDLVRELKPVSVGANERSVERSVVDLQLTADRWLAGFEYRPGDRRVVRAAFFTVRATGEWVGSWTPWSRSMKLPEGMARRLPRGTQIVAEVHYAGVRDEIEDQGVVGLHFEGQPALACEPDLVVDAASSGRGDERSRYRGEATIAAETSVVALRPEVGTGAKTLEVAARTPDGATRVLLFARDLRSEWPTPYVLEDPVVLRSGTRVSLTVHYATDAGSAPTKLTMSRCRAGSGASGPRAARRGGDANQEAANTRPLTPGE